MTSLKDMPDPAAQVIEAERQWLSAHLKLDLVLLDRLMADEFLQVNDRGELLSKQQVLASFRSGNRYWQEANSGGVQGASLQRGGCHLWLLASQRRQHGAIFRLRCSLRQCLGLSG